MRRGIAWLVLLPLLTACPREKAPDALPLGEVAFVHPQDGDTVVGPNVHVQLRAQGFVIEPALGERVEGQGHHHIFVNKDVTPDTVPIPKEVEGIIHLGTGAEEFTVKDLKAGKNRLIAVPAYGDHVPMERIAWDTVTIHVRAP